MVQVDLLIHLIMLVLMQFHLHHHLFYLQMIQLVQIHHHLLLLLLQILQIQIQLWAIGFQPLADLTDCCWSKPGARPEGGGAVVGDAEQANAAAGRVAPGSHENAAVAVESGHRANSRRMKAGTASMAPCCQ